MAVPIFTAPSWPTRSTTTAERIFTLTRPTPPFPARLRAPPPLLRPAPTIRWPSGVCPTKARTRDLRRRAAVSLERTALIAPRRAKGRTRASSASRLQIQGGVRRTLCCDSELSAERSGGGTPPEGFFGANACHVGIVVVLGEMREHDVARAPVEPFRVGQKLADRRIRQVTRAAHHALLDVPGIRPNLKHLEVVVRFQHQAIGVPQMNFHKLREISKVRDDCDFCPVRAEGKTQRVDRIVGNRKRRHFNIAH